MWEDLNTKVHNVRELVAWLDEHRSGAEPGQDAWDPEATGIMQAPQLDAMLAAEHAQQAGSGEPASVSGSLEAFHVVELLQALSSGDRTGVLELREGDHLARVHLDNGRIAAASYDDDASVEPLEALRRAAAMQKGIFRFGPEDEIPPVARNVVSLSTVQVLIELSTVAWQLAGAEDDDEKTGSDFDLEAAFGAFDEPSADTVPRDTNPSARPPSASAPSAPAVSAPTPSAPAPVYLPPVAPFGSRPLRLPDPLVPRLRDLSPEELDVLQAILRHRTLDAAVGSIRGDGERMRALVHSLLARGYLVP